jgi:hypothetical protein
MSEYGNAALELIESMRALRERRRLQMAKERMLDGQLAQERKHLRRVGKTGRLVRQISTAAVMNAVDSEGRDVLSAAGEEYWKDQDRREFGIQDGGGIKSMRNRHGRVAYRKVYG